MWWEVPGSHLEAAGIQGQRPPWARPPRGETDVPASLACAQSSVSADSAWNALTHTGAAFSLFVSREKLSPPLGGQRNNTDSNSAPPAPPLLRSW